ncbi:MAG: SGNH/GDSL hydrolase family protein [Planctomycetota bacterium]|nr:SGNH/GDSL hydrolase family protein [Planctomycetota bacterium]
MNAPNRMLRSPRRRWWFRCAAIALGLSVFGLVELMCLVFHWGESPIDDDPYVGFSTSPLFQLSETGDRYEIAKPRRPFFATDSFPARKGPDTRRVFCLGGSTVQGRPYSKETSFTTWLRLALDQADKQHEWDVVNCGGISYASYRLVPILQECLNHHPDVIVLCTGHNEFLEDRTYADVKARAKWLAKPDAVLSRLRSFNALRQWVSRSTGTAAEEHETKTRQTLKGEVDALLDYRDGLSAYGRDDVWRRGVIEHFAFNVRRMIRLCRAANVPIVLIAPPSNLADCPPFKSAHREGWTAADDEPWDARMATARSRMRGDPAAAIESFQAANNLDDEFALTHYEIGLCLESLGRVHEARDSFVRARDTDICPLRILSPMFESIVETARELDVPLLDAHALLESQAPGNMLGDFLLVDHVHPSFRGHQEIAMALVTVFTAQKWVAPFDGWQTQAQAAFQAHFDQIDDLYFLRGKRMLKALQSWTKGRADGPSIETRRR